MRNPDRIERIPTGESAFPLQSGKGTAVHLSRDRFDACNWKRSFLRSLAFLEEPQRLRKQPLRSNTKLVYTSFV